MKIHKLEIDLKDLPLLVELKINGILKEYVLKANKDKTGVFLNKKESY
jgi:hypothetical protein